jgi:hypothetical protein
MIGLPDNADPSDNLLVPTRLGLPRKPLLVTRNIAKTANKANPLALFISGNMRGNLAAGPLRSTKGWRSTAIMGGGVVLRG